MHDDISRITELADLFHSHGQPCTLRASDPQAFVRMVYIVKSALDRHLGVGNRHSAELVGLCDSVEDMDHSAGSLALCERYGRAAGILRAAVAQNADGGQSSGVIPLRMFR